MKKLTNAVLGTAMALCGTLNGIDANAQTALSTDMNQVSKPLDLFFVAQNSNLYETIYPFLTATQITGISSRPSVAAMGNVVSYVNTIYGAPEVFYVTTDSSGNQDIEQLWGTQFSPTNLSQQTGAASAVSGSSLVGFIDSCANSDNVFYIGNNGHVELLNWTPAGWTTQDLTKLTNTGLAVGTAIVGHIKGSGLNQSQEIFYVESDNNVHELWRWSGCAGGAAFDGWHNANVSTANGDTGVSATPGSSLAALYDSNAGTDAVFYVGTDGHLHDLFFSAAGIWSNIDITRNANGPALLPGTALAAHVNTIANSEEVYYFDTSENVRGMWAWSSNPTTWNSPAASINSYASGAPAAAVGSPLLTDMNTLASLDDVYYIGTNNNIYELSGGSWRSITWHSINITSQSGGPTVRRAPPSNGSTVINFDTDTLGNAITSGTVINNTYASWGVTFSALPCNNAPCVVSGGNVYAVAYSDASAGISNPKGSAPNAVSTMNTGFFQSFMQASVGVIRATFATPQSAVSIMAYQFCPSALNQGCIGTFPASASAYLDAYDSTGNLLCHTPANPKTWFSWQQLLVTSTCGQSVTAVPIAYVQFSVGYDQLNSQLMAEFDNLTF